MASVTRGLTAEDRDQLRNPALVSSTGPLRSEPLLDQTDCVAVQEFVFLAEGDSRRFGAATCNGRPRRSS